jgi:uncharacterized membrane protein (DUF485 family)
MVQAGALFEYLAAFITIVLGLALADLLISLHRLLRERNRVIWRPLPLLLALFVFLALLTGFFDQWEMTGWRRIGYFGLVWQIVLAVPVFLAACAVLPDKVPSGRFDLDHFYFGERRYIFSLLAVANILMAIDDIFNNWDALWRDPTKTVPYFLVNFIFLALIGAMAWSDRKWVHWLSMALLFILAGVGFAAWEISGAPAFVPTS